MVASDGVVLTRRQSVYYLLIVITAYSRGSYEGSTQATMLHNTKYIFIVYIVYLTYGRLIIGFQLLFNFIQRIRELKKCQS